MASDDNLKATMAAIGIKLALIAQMLPKDYNLTLVARHRANHKAHFILGDDEAPAIRQVLLDLDNDIQALEVTGSEANAALLRVMAHEG